MMGVYADDLGAVSNLDVVTPFSVMCKGLGIHRSQISFVKGGARTSHMWVSHKRTKPMDRCAYCFIKRVTHTNAAIGRFEEHQPQAEKNTLSRHSTSIQQHECLKVRRKMPCKADLSASAASFPAVVTAREMG